MSLGPKTWPNVKIINLQLLLVSFFNIVSSCPTKTDAFFTLTALGDISVHTLRHDVFDQTSPKKYNDHNAHEVETALYCRQIDAAYEALIKYCRAPRDSGVFENQFERELLNECTPVPPIESSSWEIASFPADYRKMVANFVGDLESYCVALPPGFQSLTKIRESNQKRFNLQKLRLNLVDQLLKDNLAFLIEEEKTILQGLEYDLNFLDMETFNLVIEKCISYSRVKALAFGLKMGQNINDLEKANHASMSRSLSLLLFPSVFDELKWLPRNTGAWSVDEYRSKIEGYIKNFKENEKRSDHVVTQKSGRRRIVYGSSSPQNEKPKDTFVGNLKHIVPMISLELRIAKYMESAIPPTFNEDIIAIMQNVLSDNLGGAKRGLSTTFTPFENTISVSTNMLYLESLQATKRFDDYFSTIINLILVEIFKLDVSWRF